TEALHPGVPRHCTLVYRGTASWCTEALRPGVPRHCTLVYRGTAPWCTEALRPGVPRHCALVYRGTAPWCTEALRPGVPRHIVCTPSFDVLQPARLIYVYSSCIVIYTFLGQQSMSIIDN
ncbi:hypothetical protein LSAT2_004998, partial [Lamellibrachia satsuma]